MVKIAIQGHPTRGKEVIQILESLGGINSFNLLGTRNGSYYFIEDNNLIINRFDAFNHKLYTLEEFEKEFPFKIGDKVRHISSIGTIRKYCYIDNKPGYEVESMELGIIANIPAEILKPYKEMQKEINITLSLDKAKEWYNKGGELKEIALQAYSEEELNKLELPKTWEEFCDNYPIKKEEYFITNCSNIISVSTVKENRNSILDRNNCPSEKSAEAHLALIQLEQLRDCYRQGDIPDFNNCNEKYCIIKQRDNINIIITCYNNYFLSFTKKEVAQKFLANFKPLIKIAEDYI